MIVTISKHVLQFACFPVWNMPSCGLFDGACVSLVTSHCHILKIPYLNKKRNKNKQKMSFYFYFFKSETRIAFFFTNPLHYLIL